MGGNHRSPPVWIFFIPSGVRVDCLQGARLATPAKPGIGWCSFTSLFPSICNFSWCGSFCFGFLLDLFTEHFLSESPIFREGLIDCLQGSRLSTVAEPIIEEAPVVLPVASSWNFSWRGSSCFGFLLDLFTGHLLH